jgi:hypothetical protein
MKGTSNKPYVAYANKLMHFLNNGAYDNDTLCLLGVIAAKARRKHMKLDDGIKTAITDLLLENADGMILITRTKLL